MLYTSKIDLHWLIIAFSFLHFASPARADGTSQVIDKVRERLKKLEEEQSIAPSTLKAPPATQAHAPARALRKPAATADEPSAPPTQQKKKRKRRSGPITPQTSPSIVLESHEDPPVPQSPEEEESRLTKNWGGARKQLSEKGIDLGLTYKAEFTRNFVGGLQRASTYLGNVDFKVALDAEKLVGWKGGSAFFYVLNDHGGHPSLENIGDLQVASNIETTAASTKLYEAWLQQLAFDGKVSFLAGLHDLNSEFYVTDTSGLFFSSSFGVGKDLSQTNVPGNGPSIFPTTAPAIRVRAEPTKSFYIQAAAFNGQSGDPSQPRGTHIRLNARDGALLITEFAFLRGKGEAKELYSKYGMGAWTYTKTFDSQTQKITASSGGEVPIKETSHGIYFLGEQALTERLAVFLRYGIASTEVNRIGSSLGTGVVITGLVPGRPKDRFGVAFARLANGDEYRQAKAASGERTTLTESTIEANYRVELIPGIAVQPDVQHIVHPNTNPEISNAWVGALRFELSF